MYREGDFNYAISLISMPLEQFDYSTFVLFLKLNFHVGNLPLPDLSLNLSVKEKQPIIVTFYC